MFFTWDLPLLKHDFSAELDECLLFADLEEADVKLPRLTLQ